MSSWRPPPRETQDLEPGGRPTSEAESLGRGISFENDFNRLELPSLTCRPSQIAVTDRSIQPNIAA